VKRIFAGVLLVFVLLSLCRAESAGSRRVLPAKSKGKAVDAETMQRIYEQIKTPYKYGVILKAQDGKKLDCPSVYRHGRKWCMMYIIFDGNGYNISPNPDGPVDHDVPVLRIDGPDGEVVVDYSLRLKNELKDRTLWVAAYSNDVFGYIPSLRVLKEGGYEAGDAMRYTELPGPFAPSVETLVINKVHQLVKSVRISKKNSK